MERPPADYVLLALLAVGLAADVPLIRGGHASISERAGATVVRRALVAYLACHFLRIGPSWLDPLSLAARPLRRRYPPCPLPLSPSSAVSPRP